MQNAAQNAAGTRVRPIMVDVYAKLVDGVVEFDHDWKFDGDPTTKKGIIEVPPGAADDPATKIQFHLRDSTGLNLQFIKPTQDAMWVSQTNKCPIIQGNGGQIAYKHPWSAKMLQVEDANSGPPCTLYYVLRFSGDAQTDPDGKEHPPYVYDPDIKNGGGTVPAAGGGMTAAAVIAVTATVVALIAVAFWLT